MHPLFTRPVWNYFEKNNVSNCGEYPSMGEDTPKKDRYQW